MAVKDWNSDFRGLVFAGILVTRDRRFLAQTYQTGLVRPMSASVMGRCLSSPSNSISPPGSCFRPLSTKLPPHYACQIGSGSQSFRRDPATRAATSRHTALTGSFVPAAGHGQEGCYLSCPEERLLFPYAAAFVSFPQRKSVSSIHMRCRMIASLRAHAILARCRPRRLATCIAQRLRLD